jgi:translation initiation factor 2 subunit 2
MQQDYEKLLEKAYSSIPASKMAGGERFEAPVADAFIQGNKTIIRNYGFICSRLRRKPEEIAKYLSKELAAPAVTESNGEQLVLQTKLSNRIINEKLSFYIQNAVLCNECGKPDTHIDLIQGVRVLICEACGARKPIR